MKFFGGDKVNASEEKVRTYYRRFLGGSIWALQTRYDVGFWATLFSTSPPYLAQEPPDIWGIPKLSNKAIKVLTDKAVGIHFAPLFKRAEKLHLDTVGGIADLCFRRRRIRAFVGQKELGVSYRGLWPGSWPRWVNQVRR